MAEEYRNFRSYYYDKVGFRGVEERKSLEILLSEKPLNLSKLTQFCLRFSLPTMYREYVWNILLGVLPTNPESQQPVSNEHKEQFKELHHCLEVMDKIDKSTPLPQVLAYMVLLEEGQLRLNHKQQLLESSTQHLLSIATTFTRMCSEPSGAYFLLHNFWILQLNSSSFLSNMIEKFNQSFKLEDPQLFQHFQVISAFHVLPLATWFSRCFAEVLPENSLERIWDKVIAGSSKIMVNLAVALLTILRRPLLNYQSTNEIVTFLKRVPEDTADCVVNKALESWHINNAS